MKSLKNKTILITGATDGLGKALAATFASNGASLLLHGRNQQKGEVLIQELIEQSKNIKIRYYNANFGSLNEVRKMCDDICLENDHLDLLINNAAIGGGPKHNGPRELSIDGYELRFAVNYLSHFVVTNKLLPLLKNSKSPRILFVSSIGQAAIDFKDLMMEKSYDSFTAYCRSKLAQIIFGFSLSEKLKSFGINVNSLHPATLMPTNMVFEFFGRSTSTIEEGVKSVLHVGCSDETHLLTGNYFNQKQKAKAHMQAYDVAIQEQLWHVSEKLAGEK